VGVERQSAKRVAALLAAVHRCECNRHRDEPGATARSFGFFVYCQEMTSSETLVPFR
jgi:hypothetical protein